MGTHRKETEQYILGAVEKIAPGGQNASLYADLFKSMSDAQFDKWIKQLESEEATLSIIIPPDGSIPISVEKNLSLIKSMFGKTFYQKLITKNASTGNEYKTPVDFIVYILPVRRAAQLLTKGISIPENTTHVNTITGQVTGESQSTKITLPEMQVMVGTGLHNSLMELVKARGGDLGAARALEGSLYKNGTTSQELIAPYSTGVESTMTLKAYFQAAHIKSTL